VLGVEAWLEVVVAKRLARAEPGGLSREGQQEGAEEEDAAGVHGGRRLDERAKHERRAPRGERHRDDVRHLAGRVGEPRLRPPADPSPVPVAVEDHAEVETQSHQADADDVEMTLLEPAERLACLRPDVAALATIRAR
jgi:hypothetical protein